MEKMLRRWLLVASLALTATADRTVAARTHLQGVEGGEGGQDELLHEVKAARKERDIHEEVDHEEEKAKETKWAILGGLASLTVTFSLGHALEVAEVHWFPSQGVGILCGLVCALFAEFTGRVQTVEQMRFDYEFFIIWLLPPIMFEAAFNMNVSAFFASLAPTLFFAFAGLLISTFIVGGLIYGAGQLGICYPLSLLASLTFGSLISATDPVSVLAVFQSLGVKSDLFAMVFGESVLNDATAIVLTNTLLSFNQVPFTSDAVMSALHLFGTNFFGSIAIGVGFGLASSILFKKLQVTCTCTCT